jgi:hypothetical protein
MAKSNIYENPAEYPAIYGEDECSGGIRDIIPIHGFQEAPHFKAMSFTISDLIGKVKYFRQIYHQFSWCSGKNHSFSG